MEQFTLVSVFYPPRHDNSVFTVLWFTHTRSQQSHLQRDFGSLIIFVIKTKKTQQEIHQNDSETKAEWPRVMRFKHGTFSDTASSSADLMKRREKKNQMQLQVNVKKKKKVI